MAKGSSMSSTTKDESAKRGQTLRNEFGAQNDDGSVYDNGKAMGNDLTDKGLGRTISGSKVPEI